MRILPRKWGRAAFSSTPKRGPAGAQRVCLGSPAPAQTPTSPSSSKISSNDKASTNSKVDRACCHAPMSRAHLECSRGGVVQCTHIIRGAPLITRLRSPLKSEEAREFNHVQSNLPPESSPPVQPASSLGIQVRLSERPRAEHGNGIFASAENKQSSNLLAPYVSKKRGLPNFPRPYSLPFVRLHRTPTLFIHARITSLVPTTKLRAMAQRSTIL